MEEKRFEKDIEIEYGYITQWSYATHLHLIPLKNTIHNNNESIAYTHWHNTTKYRQMLRRSTLAWSRFMDFCCKRVTKLGCVEIYARV